MDAVGAKKGPDSVRHGIQWLKEYEIVIDKSCQNAINEFETYHWKKDREGNSLNIPADRNNHIIDAVRYALESDMLEDVEGDLVRFI